MLALLLLTAAGPADRVSFDTQVRPILKALCFHCHGEEARPKGKLDLRLVRLMHAGGTSGPAVVPGKPAESPLWERVAADEMPEGPKKLTAAQKTVLKRWIEQGARADGPEPADPAAAKFTAAELGHWAFRPVRPVAGGIDEMLLAKLKAAGVAGFSPAADKRTLVRRVTFDLTGLPPTPDEVAAFLADDAPDAYARVVDRLLASPHYGERWGRHWLDVAGYAETDGNPTGTDHPRPHAWRYRDWVVRSLNADKPFDQFVREQLAGDELAPHPWNLLDPATVERLTATGFLRMAPDVTQPDGATLADKNQAAADVVRVVGSAVLGLTVGCAQCHDHRYDPVTHEDYHRLRAVFDPAFDLTDWKKPADRVVDATPAADRWRAARIEAQAKQREAAVESAKRWAATAILERELRRVPADQRAAVRAAAETPEGKQTPADRNLLATHRNVKPVAFVVANIEEIDKPAFHRFEAAKKEIERLRATKPAPRRVMVPAERPDHVPVSRLFARGDPEQPKQAVSPGEPLALSQHRPADIPANSPAVPTTGRRLALAERLTDGTHPLTARVIVNRVWLHHFGRGLVNTPGDFGLNGERPTNPELLDHLAATFVADGWSLKTLHRRVVLTEAYRQQSRRTPQLDKLDPDNKLVGRMSVRRLEAEAVRDALLSVSGRLNPAVGGPSVPVTEDHLGRGVLGRRVLSTFGKPYGDLTPVSDADARRRSLYVTAHRSMPLSVLETFDLPAMAPNCDLRRCSTVPPQALLLLNDATVVGHADKLMERLGQVPGGPAERVGAAFALLYAAEPTAAELALCLTFLDQQAAHFRTHVDAAWLANVEKWPHAPDLRSLSALCQTLLAANRFLYVD